MKRWLGRAWTGSSRWVGAFPRFVFRGGRIQAVLMVLLMLSVPLAALGGSIVSSEGLLDAPRSDAPVDGWVGDPLSDLLGENGLLAGGDEALLRMLDQVGATPAAAELPVASHVLGLAVPAPALPALYEARALAAEHPLRNALEAYNEALRMVEPERLHESPEWHAAQTLSRESQTAMAVLLYAITDASMLQKQAVSGMSPEDYTRLVTLPGAIQSGALDLLDGSEEMDERFGSMQGLLSQVDRALIDQAAMVMAHAVSHALPTLRAWGEEVRTVPDLAPLQGIDDMARRHTPASIEAMDPVERLDLLVDALAAASRMQGLGVPSDATPLPPPAGDHPLRDAIQSLADAMGMDPTLADDPAYRAQLHRADLLPESLQKALARIVVNQVSLLEAHAPLLQMQLLDAGPSTEGLGESGEDEIVSALAATRLAEIRVVRAVQESAPTLTAWGIAWSREQNLLPATPYHATGKMDAAADLGAAIADPAAGLQDLLALAGQTRGVHSVAAPEPPLPPRGALEGAVLALYSHYGINPDADELAALRAGVAALPETVERNTARVLLAQVEGLAQIEEAWEAIGADGRAALQSGPHAVGRLLAGGEVGMHELRAMRQYDESFDTLHTAYLEAALHVAAAMDASSQELGEMVDEELGPEPITRAREDAPRPWYKRLVGAIADFRVIGTASAQTLPGEPVAGPTVCPSSPLADCGNDIWFMDPVLETVVVAGFADTEFDPRRMGQDWSRPDLPAENDRNDGWASSVEVGGQLLTLALGGDNVYRNNAGGAFPATVRGEVVRSPMATVAVAIDLAGDDRYLPPPPGHEYPVTQGSAHSGIGFLYDRRGNDVYVASGRAQGYGSNGGIGVLLDGDGSDLYEAGHSAQGAADGGLGLLVDRAGSDRYRLLDGTAESPALGQGGAASDAPFNVTVGGVRTPVLSFGGATITPSQGSGLGVLVDGDGDDAYRGGMQGRGTGSGVGVLVDLAGSDSYTRTHDDGQAYQDGQCRTSLRVLHGGLLPNTEAWILDTTTDEELLPDINPQESVPDALQDSSEDVEGRADDLAETVGEDTDAQDLVGDPFSGHGAFIDLGEEGACEAGLVLPGAEPDQLVQDVEQLLAGSLECADHLVCIAPLLVLGDSGPSSYPDCGVEDDGALSLGTLGKVDACNSLVSVDLGGDDTYENLAGGVDLVTFGVAGNVLRETFRLPGVLVDMGGDDDYINTRTEGCVQGCNSFLIDLVGDDTYEAWDRAQGVSTTFEIVGKQGGGGGTGGNGMLFDAAGDDEYVILTEARRAIAQGGVGPRAITDTSVDSYQYKEPQNPSGTGMLLDALGDDEYRSPVQGVVDARILITSVTGGGQPVALFLDFSGDDRYSPVGRQGQAEFRFQYRGCCHAGGYGPASQTGFAVFVDASGRDSYVGTVDIPTTPDMSQRYNNRLDASPRAGVQAGHSAFIPIAHGVASLSLFWDIDRDDPQGLAGLAQSWQDGSRDDHRTGPLAFGVGSRSDDTFAPGDNYVLLVNPGGDNTYRNNAGATLFRGADHVDDTSASQSASASSFKSEPGVLLDPERNHPIASLLIDLAGDDTYEPDDAYPRLRSALPSPHATGTLVQGAGFLGVGMLVDDAGHETYTARNQAQGFGLYGWGVLWDNQGDDLYQYDPAMVRRPAIHDGLVAWAEFVPTHQGVVGAYKDTGNALDNLGDPPPPVVDNQVPTEPAWSSTGAWRIKAWQQGQSCAVLAVTPKHAGPVQGIAVGPPVPALEGQGVQSRVAYSVHDAATGTWRAFTTFPNFDAGCQDDHPQLELNLRRLSDQGIVSNQVNPRFMDANNMVWQDDRDDTWSLYRRSISTDPKANVDALVANDLGMLGSHEPGSSNQVNPDVAIVSSNPVVVYQDDRHARTFAEGDDTRCGGGTWSIHAYNIFTGSEQRLTPDCGIHANPRISDSLATWQTWNDTTDSWDLSVRNHAGELRILQRPGDQYEPTVSGKRVLFTEQRPDGRYQVVRYDWLADTSRVERHDAIQPALDPVQSNDAVWVDTTGRPTAGPVESRYWEIHGRTVGRSDPDASIAGDPISNLYARAGSSWLQGASYAAGRGVLFDVGGLDTYLGDRFAQGAAASLNAPFMDFNRRGTTPLVVDEENVGAYGLLVDVDGNDEYRARGQSQGVHHGRELMTMVGVINPQGDGSAPPLIDQEATANVGILLDLRGNDRFDANRDSQGFGAWVLGAGATRMPADGGEQNNQLPARAFLGQSYGLFLDLGGLDAYCYGPGCGSPQIHPPSRVDVGTDPCLAMEQTVFQAAQDLASSQLNETIRQQIWSAMGAARNETVNEATDGVHHEQLDGANGTIDGAYNETVEGPIWPSGEDEDLTTFQFLEEMIHDTVDAVSTTCRDLQAELGDLVEGADMLGLVGGDTVRARPDREEQDRNDQMWRQKAREGSHSVIGSRDVVTCAQGERNSMGACNVVMVILGGIGMDLPIVDRMDGLLHEVAEQFINVEVEAYDLPDSEDPVAGDSGNLPELKGTRWLAANVEIEDEGTGLGVKVERVEFFRDGGFVGYNTSLDPREGHDLFLRPWDTTQVRDDDYDVRTRVHYVIDGLPGFTLGFAEGDATFRVDNVPRVLTVDAATPIVSTGAFSPAPHDPDGERVSAPPVVRFTVPPDPFADPTAGDVDAWVVVELWDEPQQTRLATLLPEQSVSSATDAQVEWNGKIPDGSGGDVIAPSGLYNIRIAVTDREDGLDEPVERVSEEWSAVRVHSDSPTRSCVRLAGDCNEGGVINIKGAKSSGEAGVVFDLPLDLESTDSLDPARFHVFTNVTNGNGDLGDLEWSLTNVTSSQVQITVPTGYTMHVVAIGQDRMGNLECSPDCGGERVDKSPADPAARFAELLEARDRKLQLLGNDAVATFTVDIQKPDILDFEETHPRFTINGDDRVSGSFPVVGPDDEVIVRFVVREESGPPVGRLAFQSNEHLPGQNVLPPPAVFRSEPGSGIVAVTTSDDLNEQSSCDPEVTRCYVVEWDAWSDLVDPWAEGVVTVELNAFDAAGNLAVDGAASRIVETLILDRTPPDLLVPVEVEYQEGRLHAEHGEEVTVRIVAEDPRVTGGWDATATRDLHLAIDGAHVEQFTTALPDSASCVIGFDLATGTSCFRPNAVDVGGVRKAAWETTIPIDIPAGLEGDLRADRFPVRLDITDGAGNTLETTFEVVVGDPLLGLAEKVVPQVLPQVGVYDFTTQWTTVNPAFTHMLYGKGTTLPESPLCVPVPASPAADCAGASEAELHTFHVDGLEPGTGYAYRIIAEDPETGALEAGPLREFRTLHGVELDLDLGDGSILSGVERITGTSRVLSAVDAGEQVEPRVMLRLHGPDLPEAGRPVLDAATSSNRFAVELVTDALEDGEYTLVATASHLGEVVEVTARDLLIDNTPPILAIISPAPDAVIARSPESIQVRVEDGSNPIDDTTARLWLDGRPIEGTTLDFELDGDGFGGVLSFGNLGRLPAGEHRIEVTVDDLARNAGFADSRFLLDPDAPEASVKVKYPAGQLAARPGQWITIQINAVHSPSGVAGVTANTTAVGGIASVAFQRDDDRYILEFPVAADTPDGLHALPLHVTDGAGNVRDLDALVHVDGKAPGWDSLVLAPTGPSNATLLLNATEPVHVTATASLDGVVAATAAPHVFTTPATAVLEGLQPGAQYSVEVQLIDRAGNSNSTTSTWHFRPETGDPPAVHGLRATATAHGIRLEWDAPADAGFRYVVQRALDGLFEPVATTLQTTHLDESVTPGETYQYFVQAVDPMDRPGEPSRVVNVQAADAEAVPSRVVHTQVTPRSGVAQETRFLFTAEVRDAATADPAAWLVLNGEARRMAKLDADADCRQACTLQHASVLDPLDLADPEYAYHVELFDGPSGDVRVPAQGALEGPTVLGGPQAVHDDAEATQAAPNPLALLLLALGAALLIHRKRRHEP